MIEELRPDELKDISHAGFFLLRTPLLPMDEFLVWSKGLKAARLWNLGADSERVEDAWGADVYLLRSRLRDIVARPEIAHALFVASASLQTGIEHWKRDPESKRGLQAERALVRYFARMCGRSTPFGLFSGCSTGRVYDKHGSRTTLMLKPRQEYRPISRLDFEYLFALTTSLQRDAEIGPRLCYWPNSSLHRTAQFWHYVESRFAGTGRTHHVVKLEGDEFLQAVLNRAQTGAKVSELVQAVLHVSNDSEVSENDAKEYVQELIANNVLVTSLMPRVTEDPLDDLIGQMQSLASNGIAESLKSVREAMAAVDQKGLGVDCSNYRAITAQLERLPAKFDASRLYQIDMVKPVRGAVLTNAVIRELISGVEVLCRLSKTAEPESLRSFRDAFTARYNRATIPLLEALDEEIGIGFGHPSADSSPLLRGLPLAGRRPDDGPAPGDSSDARHILLLQKLIDCQREGKTEVELEESDLPQGGMTRYLPNSFALNVTLVATSEEAFEKRDFEILLRGAVGPNGARLFGRFCHTSPELAACVRDYVRQEEAHDPNAVFAEIVYLPEGRVGNVLCRPVLREYEIVYLGRSGAPVDRQIPVSDLLVSVEGGQILLHSQRLRRKIIPRLTNAHGFLNPTLSPVYRFLALLQHQNGVSAPIFSWGALNNLDYLPRIRFGRLILATARWRLTREEVNAIATPKRSRSFLAMQEVRRERKLPRWVVFESADLTLPIDLDNPLSVDAFVHTMKRSQQVVLREMYPAADQLCVSSPEGRFHHELNVPFVRRPPEEKPKTSSINFANVYVPRSARVLPPGSDWAYVKVYGGAATLDEILTSAVPTVLTEVLRSGAVARWFFIRYSDPHQHLRIRFSGEPHHLQQDLLPMLSEIFNPLLASGRVWKIQFDTYDREIERYGGLEGMLVAEDIFFADSDAVLGILQQLEGDQGLDYRWRTALLGIDALLSDFGLDLEHKCAAMERVRRTDTMKITLGARFRAVRRDLEELFDVSSQASVTFGFAREVFERRSLRIQGAVQKLHSLETEGKLRVAIQDLISSYIHMHVNRLTRSSPNQHESVLYEYLFRLYDGKRAREKKRETTNQAAIE